MTPRDQLLELIERFISGENRSLAIASEIEGLVLEFFEDEPWFDDVSLALAQYSPAGGQNYYSEEALAEELAAAAKAI